MQKGTYPLTKSSRVTYMRLVVLGFFFLCFSLLTDAQDEYRLELNPQRVVVRYGGSVAVNCNTSVLHEGMGWEASEGAVPKSNNSLITWRVSELTQWDINPLCYINYKMCNENQCKVVLPVTVYQTPDSVSISTVNHRGPMKEGQQYELQCDVHDVAPVQNLTVRWYKNQTLINETTFSDTIETPVNKTVTLLIRPNRADDGAQYWCEAELDLGAEGPQPPPKNSSKPLNVEVQYKPQHSSSTETIIKDVKVMLNCSVKSNPAPDYTWSSDHLNLNISSSVIESSALSPGNYTCTATNILGRDSKVFILKPTDIAIRFVNHSGPLIVGKQYELQCIIQNVDPSKSVVVKWIKLSQTNSTDANKTSFSNSSKLQISPSKTDNGAQYSCEAGAPPVSSERLKITVHYKPIINKIKLPSTVPVFRGYPEVLVCEADGNPKPIISWSLGANDKKDSEKLNITESTPENVSCTANNSVGSDIRHVKVILKEDYLPLIAGLIAVIVAFISVIFIFILSIYYKTAKMGHYSLKNAKPSAQNGNIAQNGKHNTFPMKKLSQSSILA